MPNQSKDDKKRGGKSSGSRGTQGGTHEQHVEAGRQSHKNDNASSSGSKQSGGSGSSSGGGKQNR